MSRRNINLESMPLAHPPAMEWLRANGVDPSMVPIAQEVLVEDGKITLKIFAFHENGTKQIKQVGGDFEPVFETITVPLISAPENHGL